MKSSKGTTKPVTDSKKRNINLKPVYSFIGVVLLAVLAFKGAESYIQGPPALQTGLAVLFVALLVKLAVER